MYLFQMISFYDKNVYSHLETSNHRYLGSSCPAKALKYMLSTKLVGKTFPIISLARRSSSSVFLFTESLPTFTMDVFANAEKVLILGWQGCNPFFVETGSVLCSCEIWC